MTAITKSEAELHVGDDWWGVYLPIAPVPAARPRVGRWGTYYPKTYQKWKSEAAELLRPFWNDEDPTEDALCVAVHAVAKRPKKLTRPMPRPDVDNYVKAALDAITGGGFIWNDDSQVEVLLATKRYAEVDEEPHTFIYVCRDPEHLLTGLTDKGEDVKIMHAKGDEWFWFYLPVFVGPMVALGLGLWFSGRVGRGRRA